MSGPERSPTRNSPMSLDPTPSPKRKMTVKDIFKSKNSTYTPFPPTSRYAKHRDQSVPFSLTQHKGSHPPPIRSAQSLLHHFKYSENDNPQDQDSDPEVTPTRQLRARKPQPKPMMIDDEDFLDESDDDEEENDDDDDDEAATFTRRLSRKRKRGNGFLDSDEDDDMDDGEDGAYVDKDDKDREMKERLAAETERKERIIRLKKIFSRASDATIADALKRTNGSATEASKLLAGLPFTPSYAQPSSIKPLKRLQQKRPVEDSQSMDDKEGSDGSETDDGGETSEDEQERIQRAIKDRKTVHFYNIKPSQDIQDVTGCTPEQAEKLIALRPFKDIDELRDTLQQERGLSVRFINSYIDMMDGYSVVDQIIEKIEDLGGELKSIVNVWEGVDIDAVQEDQEDAGMHLSGAAVSDKKNNTDNSGIDKSSDLYHDAMDGFLTEQPKIVNDEFKLKDYQLVGINWMLMLYRKGISGILADEMGLGKTAQVISFLGRLYELGNKGPHLIIVPTSTLDNWLREFERFCPELNVYGYYGTQAERFDMREELMDEETKEDYQVIVTTYTVATGNIDDRKFLRKLKCKSMILDEGHMIRNCTSARYTHLMALKTPFRLLLTGTPLQNNLQELVSLLMFIMPDLLVDYEEEIRKIFKIKAVTTATKDSRTASSSAQILSQERIERAKKMMTPFVLRRRKADVLKDLPQKIHVIERCKMTKSQQNLYSTILSESKQSYKEALDSKPGEKKDKMDRFKNIIMELRKAADHPLLFRHIYDDAKLRKMAKAIMKEEKYWDANEEYIYEDMTVMSDFELNRLCKDHKSISRFALKKQEWMDSGKVEKLKELLPAMKAKEQKVLLFSQFTRLLDILELVMDTLNIKYLRLDGETKPAERQERIDRFNEDKDIDVFLLSTKAGGFGINLTSANIVVLYDTDFNPQNDRQAEDRAHRVGQTRDVTVYKMVADNSVEEHILRMADIKLRLDRSVSGLSEDTEGESDEQMEKEKVHSLLKTVLLSS